MKKCISLLGLIMFYINSDFAQSSEPLIKAPIYFDVSPPLRDMVKIQPPKADNSWKEVRNHFNVRKNKNKQVFNQNWVDPVIQNFTGTRSVTVDTTIQNFDGNSNTQGYYPPDTYGDVGPNHYFQIVNCHFSIYNKTGTLLLGPTSNSTIWNGMPNNSNGGDGVVAYDEQADRWLVAQLSYPNGFGTQPFLEMIAVSQTPDPTGSWYRWEYNFTDFPDYPKFGIWPDGYYMSINRFSPSQNFLGIGASAFDRTAMIAGNATAQMVYFTLPSSNNAYSILPSDCDGAFPAAGTPDYFTYMMDGPDYLGIYEFHVNWTTPANSTFGNYLQLPVSTFNPNLSGIPQKGTTQQVDPLSDRLMYRLEYRKFNDHQSMVANHTVNAGSGIAGVRWYELRKTTGDWSVYQQSTYSPDANHRWMGSIAVDTAGEIALGYSISSSTLYPSIRYTGRLKNDYLNAMTIGERGIVNGGGSETGGGTPGRWGDYSSLTVDPSSPVFWYTQEYFATTSSTDWNTRIASFALGNTLILNVSVNQGLICNGDTAQLLAIVSGGSGTYTYSWTSVPPGFTSNIMNPVAYPALNTQYFITINDGTQSLTGSVNVTVQQEPVMTAGNDTTWCVQNYQIQLNGQASNFRHIIWSTLGDGSFNNDTIAKPLYFPGNGDKTAMKFTSIMTVYPLNYPYGPCTLIGIDSVTISLDPCTGIDSPGGDIFTLKIVPNPTHESVTFIIESQKKSDVNLTVSDLKGKIMYDKNVSGSAKLNLDVSSFAKGIYFVHLKSSEFIKTEKLVIN